MKKSHQPFMVFRRTGSPVFYAGFWDEQQKKYACWKSTGEVERTPAIVAAQRMMDLEQVQSLSDDPKVIEYALSYWKSKKRKITHMLSPWDIFARMSAIR
jgi:hypothetical protein